MTKTQDELKAAVERVDKALDIATKYSGGMAFGETDDGHLSFADLRLILAALRPPDPEVERLREEIEVAAVHLQLAGGWLREAGDDGQRANTLLNASNRARAALSSNSGGR